MVGNSKISELQSKPHKMSKEVGSVDSAVDKGSPVDVWVAHCPKGRRLINWSAIRKSDAGITKLTSRDTS